MHVMKECSVLVNVPDVVHSVFDTFQLILSSSLDPSLVSHEKVGPIFISGIYNRGQETGGRQRACGWAYTLRRHHR
mgnify:CR=1 FL=1